MALKSNNSFIGAAALLGVLFGMICYWAAKVYVPWLQWVGADIVRIAIYGGMGAIPFSLFARRLQSQEAYPKPGETLAMVYVALCILRQVIAALSLLARRKEPFAVACYAFFPLQLVFLAIAIYILTSLATGRRKSDRLGFEAIGALLVIAGTVDTLGHLLLYPHLYLL